RRGHFCLNRRMDPDSDAGVLLDLAVLSCCQTLASALAKASAAGRGVTQIVQIHLHNLPANGWSEQTEPIKAATLVPDVLLQRERHGFLSQLNGDGSLAIFRGRVVDERPVVNLPRYDDRAR